MSSSKMSFRQFRYHLRSLGLSKSGSGWFMQTIRFVDGPFAVILEDTEHWFILNRTSSVIYPLS